MAGWLVRLAPVAILGWGLLAAPARADEPPAGADQDKLARLEALLEAQQKKIDALEQQVAAQAQADMNAARIEQMREQIREVLKDQEFRESLMPTTLQAGYKKGFFIQSTDEKFRIRFNGQLQFRYTYYNMQTRNRYLLPRFNRHDRSGFDFARARFKISGHVFDPALTYWLELDMSSFGGYDAGLLYGWVDYKVSDPLHIQMGVFRLASTRADYGSTTTMQFPEYPTENSIFGLVRGTGVRFWGTLLKGRGEYYLDIVNTWVRPDTQTLVNDEQLYTNGHDNSPAIIAHTIWQVLKGEMKYPDAAPGKWWDPAPDLEYHTAPAFNVGAHYAFNEDEHDGTMKVPFAPKLYYREGGFALTSSDGLQIHQVGLDAGFKYCGFSMTGEYVVRAMDMRGADGPPFAPLYQLTGEGSTTTVHGGYLQAGYLLPIPNFERKIEVVGRFGGLATTAGDYEGTWTYEAGVNYYIKGHAVKLQASVLKVQEAPASSQSYALANVNDEPLIFRVQLQVAF